MFVEQPLALPGSANYGWIWIIGVGGQTHMQTNTQTDRHINTISRPGVGAWQSEKYWYQKVTFWKILQIQIEVYPKTSIEPKYGTFYLNNEVKVHGIVLLVQLSWRVTSPSETTLPHSFYVRILFVFLSFFA